MNDATQIWALYEQTAAQPPRYQPTTNDKKASQLNAAAQKPQATAQDISAEQDEQNIEPQLNAPQQRGAYANQLRAAPTQPNSQFRDATGKIDTQAVARAQGRIPSPIPTNVPSTPPNQRGTYADQLRAAPASTSLDVQPSPTTPEVQPTIEAPPKTTNVQAAPEMDVFKKFHGTSYNPNSAADRSKMQHLQNLQQAGTPLTAKSVYSPEPPQPVTPADNNPPGTMLSRGLSRLGKGLSNINVRTPTTQPATKPSYKPLFSKGGVFNR